MLFAIKNRLGPTLLLAFVLCAAALAARTVLGLSWNVEPRLDLAWAVLLGGLVIGASDGLLHFLLLLCGDRYLSCYRALAEYFRPQKAPQIVAGGLLAAVEELAFRGVLLEGLRSLLNLPAMGAVAVTAVVFGLCHLIPRRSLWPFTVWATWEGALLGCVYVFSDSLLVSCVVHALHDIVGFSLFAMQRRTGWLMGKACGSDTIPVDPCDAEAADSRPLL
jgi:membrane protease YdiL (CAAX protease family)